ncbi:MAG: tetratricopeptide repeat protein [Thermoanaerobaculia bacterium]
MTRRIRFTTVLIALAVVLLALPAFSQDWKGRGRLEGRVTDMDGKPIEGATIKIRIPDHPDQGADAKTDAKGRWAYMGLRGGEWKISIEAPGYITGETILSVSEVMRGNPANYAMKPVPKEAPAAAGGLPPEIAEALKAGNAALEEKRWTDARAAFEKVLPVAPENVGLMMALARSYSGEGNTEKAIEMVKKVTEKEPANWGAWLLEANMLLEKGKLDEARAALEHVPTQSVTDPNIFINVGVLFMNQKKNDEAETYFSKAVDVAPAQFDGYYYRGLARIGLNNYDGARADLSKVEELAPKDSTEAKEAQQLLEALKGSKKK